MQKMTKTPTHKKLTPLLLTLLTATLITSGCSTHKVHNVKSASTSASSTNKSVKPVKKPAKPAAKKQTRTTKTVNKPAKRQVKRQAKVKPITRPLKRTVQGREVKLTPARKINLQKAVTRSIPAAAKKNTLVTAIQRPQLKYPTIVVTHLLEGSSPNDTNPRVRGDYNTLPKLTRFSQKRAFDIMQSILRQSNVKNVSELMVEVNHGVRIRDLKRDKNDKVIQKPIDEAMNIYSSSVSLEKIPAYKWIHMGQNPFMKNWNVERNRIPFLKIEKTEFL